MEIFELNGRFVLGTYSDGTYFAPMKTESKRVTGCHTVFARKLEGLFSSPNVTKYRSKSGARKAKSRYLNDR